LRFALFIEFGPREPEPRQQHLFYNGLGGPSEEPKAKTTAGHTQLDAGRGRRGGPAGLIGAAPRGIVRPAPGARLYGGGGTARAVGVTEPAAGAAPDGPYAPVFVLSSQ